MHKPTYPRPLPDHTSDPVALVKERVVKGREAGVLKEQATLQALPLQGGVLLPLEGLHCSEHTAALKDITRRTSQNKLGYHTSHAQIRITSSHHLLTHFVKHNSITKTTFSPTNIPWHF